MRNKDSDKKEHWDENCRVGQRSDQDEPGRHHASRYDQEAAERLPVWRGHGVGEEADEQDQGNQCADRFHVDPYHLDGKIENNRASSSQNNWRSIRCLRAGEGPGLSPCRSPRKSSFGGHLLRSAAGFLRLVFEKWCAIMWNISGITEFSSELPFYCIQGQAAGRNE